MRATGEIKAQGKRWVWLSLPYVWPNRILTLPRKMFPKDMQNAETVEVEVEPDSLYSAGAHYLAKLEVLRIVTRREPTGPGNPSSAEEAG